MKALVLAAGEGTRLRPLTSNIPKPLLLVAGKPYLSHLFAALKAAGIEEVVLLVGLEEQPHQGVLWRRALGRASRSPTWNRRRGWGRRTPSAWPRAIIDEDFVCVNGDVAAIREGHHGRWWRPTAGSGNDHGHRCRPVEDPTRFGVIEETEGKMVRIIEKPKDRSEQPDQRGPVRLHPRDIRVHPRDRRSRPAGSTRSPTR